MPEFAYIARNMKGERVSGKLSAASQREAVTTLSGQALFPIEVKGEKPASASLFSGRRVGGQLLAVTFAQMASLLRSGVPLMRSLEVLRDQSSNNRLKEILTAVYDDVEQGATLGEAMGKHQRVFGEMAVNMVRAGGEGGFLEDALDRVATFTEEQEDLKGRTIGALAYPAFIGVVGTLVVTGLIVFFVPKFAVMFARLRERGELPWMTDLLLNFSDALRTYGILGIVAGVAVGVFIYYKVKTPSGRRMADLIKIRLPMIGPIFQNLAVARFCRVLGTLLHNGVPIIRSLEISSAASGNRVLSEAIEDASENISSGESLAEPLAGSGHFPTTVVEMISVAEESNSLDTVLVDIADGLERRTFRRLDLMVRLIEPIMLLILAGVVLVVVISLLLPVIKMSSAL